ncbi:molybdenum cofactor cytidylyltransferase [Lewinella aquimaris]|uniref:Molybdenum cofactor cytidylyltransferase n=1 Tax=Neolewinella aquimaris TaxID=1835722 RepID=A0A840DWQ4_9BACT|nr:nucleotidyltransferase family protein [Neolewinella aquimaris]MBB4077634.1 molybdenum cofactor cytidylyltransferase [Neolewinella aquimaris]
MELAILMLAAGSSTRMGRPKQLLPWRGETLLRHTIQRTEPIAATARFVMLGAHREEIERSIKDLKINILYHQNYSEGLGSTISSGVRQIVNSGRFTHLLIALGDQPGVETRYLQQVVDAAARAPTRFIATAYGEHSGVPALFPAAYFPDLIALDGDAGAGQILKANPSGVLRLHPPAPIFDIDTPEDYRRHEGDQEHR